MAERQFSSTAQPMTLSGAINSATTSIVVNTVAGLPPATPFTLVIDRGEQTEEIVTVTGIAGTTLTILRGEDGTSAQAHGMGAAVRHMMTARDLREAHQHIAATGGVHGLLNGSALVGTTMTQTLTNKSISGTNNTLSNIPQAAVSGLPTALVTEQQAREAVNARLTTEITDRTTAVAAEATQRASVDTQLGTRVTAIEAQPTQWRAASTARPTDIKVKDSDLLYETDTRVQRIREAGQWQYLAGTPGFQAEHAEFKDLGPFATWASVTLWSSEKYDDLNAFAAPSGVFTVPITGSWEFIARADIGAGAAADSIASRLAIGDPAFGVGTQLAESTRDQRIIRVNDVNWQTTGFAARVQVTKGDQIRFQVWHNWTGGNQGFRNFSFGAHLKRADPVTF